MRSDRWSTQAEIKRVLCPVGEPARGGPVLYHNNGRSWDYPNEGHTIFLGVSGSGKSRRGTIPMVKSFIQAGESFVAIDPKGEIYYHTAAEAKGKYTIHTLDFRRIFESERWSALAAPYEYFQSGDRVKKQIALEMVDELAHTLFPVNDKADPFWPESARSVFIGATYALMMFGKPEQINMASIYQLIARGEERVGGSTVLKEFVDSLPVDSVASMLLQSYINTASDTRAGIRSTFLEGLSMFARSDGLISMLGGDDLHINSLDGSTPTAIYIILPDENPIFDSIAGVLCSQIMGHYVRLAQDKYNGKLPCRLNVCLEELGNIGKSIPALAHLMSAGRSRNIRCHLVLQSLSQLDTIYGPSEASTIRSNADVLVAFRTNHWETLNELSNKCGQREIDSGGHVSHENLITPSQLASMETGQALVTISGHTRFITWLPDFTEMFDCSNWKAPAHTIRRADTPTDVFNIKDYVLNMKRAKIDRLMSEESVSHRPIAPSHDFFPPHPPFPPCPTPDRMVAEDDASDPFSLNLDPLIAKIDQKIAELEKMEETDECRHPKEPSDGGKVILISTGISKLAAIKVIRKYTGMDLSHAKSIVDDLPHTLSFSSEKEATQFTKAISDAGGIAFPGIPEDDEDEDDEE